MHFHCWKREKIVSIHVSENERNNKIQNWKRSHNGSTRVSNHFESNLHMQMPFLCCESSQKSMLTIFQYKNCKCCQQYFIEYNTATFHTVIPFIATKYAIRCILCWCYFFSNINFDIHETSWVQILWSVCTVQLYNVMRMPSRLQLRIEEWVVAAGLNAKTSARLLGHTFKFSALNNNQQTKKHNTIWIFICSLFCNAYNVLDDRTRFFFAFGWYQSILYSLYNTLSS